MTWTFGIFSSRSVKQDVWKTQELHWKTEVWSLILCCCFASLGDLKAFNHSHSFEKYVRWYQSDWNLTATDRHLWIVWGKKKKRVFLFHKDTSPYMLLIFISFMHLDSSAQFTALSLAGKKIRQYFWCLKLRGQGKAILAGRIEYEWISNQEEMEQSDLQHWVQRRKQNYLLSLNARTWFHHR